MTSPIGATSSLIRSSAEDRLTTGDEPSPMVPWATRNSHGAAPSTVGEVGRVRHLAAEQRPRRRARRTGQVHQADQRHAWRPGHSERDGERRAGRALRPESVAAEGLHRSLRPMADTPSTWAGRPRLTSIDLILDDHRRFEELLGDSRRHLRRTRSARVGDVAHGARPRRGEACLPQAAEASRGHRARGRAPRRSTPGARRDGGRTRAGGHRRRGLRGRHRGARPGDQPPPDRGGADHPQPRPRRGRRPGRAELGEEFATERSRRIDDGSDGRADPWAGRPGPPRGALDGTTRTEDDQAGRRGPGTPGAGRGGNASTSAAITSARAGGAASASAVEPLVASSSRVPAPRPARLAEVQRRPGQPVRRRPKLSGVAGLRRSRHRGGPSALPRKLTIARST